ncbi:MAG TPA: ATP-binding protein [Reyranella sp.]|nr:ATP-binding protein [Reyranella sp.]
MTAFVGRLPERQLLRTALEGRTPRLLVVRGPSGVGKTALIEQALAEVASAAPIVGRGKYVDQTTSAGLAPVVDALSQAVDAALSRLYDPAAGAASLRGLLGAQFDTLLAAGFDAMGLPRDKAFSAGASLQSLAGTVRLVDALVRVLQWLEGFALPVVLFIDDWHRAPNEAVGFVHACSRRGQGSALKLILSARTEGAMAYPATASIVELQPLDETQQFELLSGLLGKPARARAMLEWLGDRASGLPFDLAEIALALSHEDAFVGEGEALCVDPARAAAIDHRDINQIIVQRARSLPAPVLRLGIAAALWGDRANLGVLGRCLSFDEAGTRAAADDLQANGLLRLEGNDISLPHDRIRASLLQVPPQAELKRLARAMADVLLADDANPHRQTALSLRLAGGLDEVDDPRLAVLFAAEAVATRHAAQFDLAASFGDAAWSILRRAPELSQGERFAVLREACFAAAHRRDARATKDRATLMVAAASDEAELAEAYERGSIAMRLAGPAADAWLLCREGYARFGIRQPEHVTDLHLRFATLLWRLFGRKPRRLLRHDPRTEEAITSFSNATGYMVWERGWRHSAYKSLQVAMRARLKGYDSALWQSVDAHISAALKDYRAAAELGDRALAGLGDLKSGRGMTVHRAVHFGKSWRDPRASLIGMNRLIYDYCMAENDLIGAANGVLNEALMTWRSAPTLEEVSAKLDEADGKAERMADVRIRNEIGLLIELVGRLRRPAPLSSHGLALTRDKVFDAPSTVLEYLSLVEDWPAILRLADEFRSQRSIMDAQPTSVSWRFFENLARLKSGLPPIRSELRFIRRAARANPTDQRGKFLLLRAEELHQRGSKDCLNAYAAAIEAFEQGSSRLELGLAAECAAAAARRMGDGAERERFRAIAASVWSSWGAFGKLASYGPGQLDAPTQARLAEAEAQAALAQRGERAKQRFLAEIGHELRTPLQAMQGLIDLAGERPDEINLGEMRQVFGSLKSVVDDLTELGALGAEAPLNQRPTDLSELLRSELALLQENARRKGIALESDIAALEDRHFLVDPDRLRQAVRNLLSNAVKYTDRGSVLLSARAVEDTAGKVRISLVVEDTGPGIPEERLAHVFEPFDRAGRRDAKGLGLGLPLSRRIAERMGGSLIAENRAAGGARFVLSFVAEKRSAVAPSTARAPALSILIVEDIALVRRLMARLLELDGHDVIQAGSLAQGLAFAGRVGFDLVILDLHLPDGDGLSLIERWPADHRKPPVIVATASVSRETEDRVVRAGATILRKPVAAAELRATIARIYGGARGGRRVAGFDAEMAKLARDAQEEIAKRARELADLVQADRPGEEIRQHAHKLAGLAAQFDAPAVAEAADRIERACKAGRASRQELAELAHGLAA